jgi:hypothetical protein
LWDDCHYKKTNFDDVTDEEYVDAVAVAAAATDIVVAATEITTNVGSDSSDDVEACTIRRVSWPKNSRKSLVVATANIITIDMMEVFSLFRFKILLLPILKRKYWHKFERLILLGCYFMSILTISHPCVACCCSSKYHYDRYDEGTFAVSIWNIAITYVETKVLT